MQACYFHKKYAPLMENSLFNTLHDFYFLYFFFTMADNYVIFSCTSRGRNDFVDKLGLSALPELLNNHLQLFVLLVDGSCGGNKQIPLRKTAPWLPTVGRSHTSSTSVNEILRSNASEVWPSVLIFSEVRTRANRVALKVTVPSGCRGTFMATSLWGDEMRQREWDLSRHSFSQYWMCNTHMWVDSPCRQHGEDTVFQNREAAGSSAAWWRRQCALYDLCKKGVNTKTFTGR